MNIVELLLATASRLPNHPAIVFKDETISYKELLYKINATANKLETTGIKRDMHVGLMINNKPEYIYSYFALLTLGATVVQMNPQYKVSEITYIVNDSKADVLILDDPSFNAVMKSEQNFNNKVNIITWGGMTGDHVISISSKSLEKDKSFNVVDRKYDDVAQIIYTSGTTGQPKGAMITHSNLNWMSITVATNDEINFQDRVLAVLPMFHVYANISTLLSPILQGATIYLEERFKPEPILEKLERNQITVFYGVPTMFTMFVNSADVEKRKFPYLRHCNSGGANLPVEIINRVKRLMGVDIIEAYGQTESTIGITTNPYWGVKKPGSVGLPFSGVIVKVVDENGLELNRGEIGELIFTGPNQMKGYFNKKEETEKTIKNGWVYTGDFGYCDEDGYYYIIDRKKDLIIRGGFNVYPREVEEVIYLHAAILECAVVGVPDPILGEEVAAFVVSKYQILEEDLTQFLKDHLVHYKVPRKYYFVESLPKTTSGKLLKTVLREMATQSIKA